MSCSNAKKLINWHTGWLGEKDANGDPLGDWGPVTGRSTFTRKILSADISTWRGSSLIQHSQSWTHCRSLALLLLRWPASLGTTLLSCRKLPGCWLKLITRARKSNAAYKEDLRKAAEEEKERTSPRGWQLERGRRKRPAEKRQLWSTLRSGRGPGEIFRRKLTRRRIFLRNRTIYRRRLWQKVKEWSLQMLQDKIWGLASVPRFGE